MFCRMTCWDYSRPEVWADSAATIDSAVCLSACCYRTLELYSTVSRIACVFVGLWLCCGFGVLCFGKFWRPEIPKYLVMLLPKPDFNGLTDWPVKTVILLPSFTTVFFWCKMQEIRDVLPTSHPVSCPLELVIQQYFTAQLCILPSVYPPSPFGSLIWASKGCVIYNVLTFDKLPGSNSGLKAFFVFHNFSSNGDFF
jgi:hypothetical protein